MPALQASQGERAKRDHPTQIRDAIERREAAEITVAEVVVDEDMRAYDDCEALVDLTGWPCEPCQGSGA